MRLCKCFCVRWKCSVFFIIRFCGNVFFFAGILIYNFSHRCFYNGKAELFVFIPLWVLVIISVWEKSKILSGIQFLSGIQSFIRLSSMSCREIFLLILFDRFSINLISASFNEVQGINICCICRKSFFSRVPQNLKVLEVLYKSYFFIGV